MTCTNERHRVALQRERVRIVFAVVPRLRFGLLVVLLASLVGTVAWGQESLLDLDIGEEEAPLALPGLGDEQALTEEEPPLLEQPTVGSGGGSLDDLLPGGSTQGEEIEAEPVCDIVNAAFGKSGRGQRKQKVKLLEEYLTHPYPAGRTFEFDGYSNEGKGTIEVSTLGRYIMNIEYYEQRMLRRAATRLSLRPHELSAASRQISFTDQKQFEQASGSVALLTTALAEHDSAVERRIRQGASWASVREALFQSLFNVQLGQIRFLLEQGQVQQATAACDRLKKQLPLGSPNQKFLNVLYDQVFLSPAEEAVDARNYALARDLLESYRTRHPFSQNKHFHAVQKRLNNIALEVAQRAVASKNVKLLDQAAEIWPQLAGLDDMRRRMVQDYPVMHCAYGTLPRRLSPFTARTPVERHAASLLFERLVRWRNDPRSGAHYAPQLASNYPVPLQRGRRFELPHCVWSDSESESPRYCTVEDVRWSMQLMKQVNPPGFSRAWSSLVADVNLPDSGDPFQASIKLQRDHWQPLSLMDFPIVPKRSFPTCGENAAELKAFEVDPVGTGPYVRAKNSPTNQVRLVANPVYRKPGLPHIREVVFHGLEAIEARDEFLKGYVHLIHGVQPAHVVELRQQGKRVDTIPARGVYFLAPNYREPLLQNRDLRLAIAHTIDRDKILDAYYRPGNSRRDHAPLSGPFPAGSWAQSDRVPDYASSQAGAFLANAQKKISLRPLTLVYPDRDQATALACAEIQRQLKGTGIQVQLKPIEPGAFHEVVAGKHGFDLAYWRHDYEDETYWLWPLFDPTDRGEGGSNFMGHVPDDTLSDLFHEMMIHKKFVKIRSLAHEIHEYFSREAVVIPLWQLDTYVAVSDQLEGAEFDPLYFFENVQQWKLQAK